VPLIAVSRSVTAARPHDASIIAEPPPRVDFRPTALHMPSVTPERFHDNAALVAELSDLFNASVSLRFSVIAYRSLQDERCGSAAAMSVQPPYHELPAPRVGREASLPQASAARNGVICRCCKPSFAA